MVKYTQTIRRQQPPNCLNKFDHFVGLELKGFSKVQRRIQNPVKHLRWSSLLSTVNNFRKMLHLRWLTGFRIPLWNVISYVIKYRTNLGLNKVCNVSSKNIDDQDGVRRVRLRKKVLILCFYFIFTVFWSFIFLFYTFQKIWFEMKKIVFMCGSFCKYSVIGLPCIGHSVSINILLLAKFYLNCWNWG